MYAVCDNVSLDRRCYKWGWHPYSIIILIGSWGFYNINGYLNYFILLIYIIGLGYSVYKKQLELLYFPLIFFDTVLVLPMGGSFFPLYEIAFVVNIFINKRLKIPRNKHILIFIISILMCCIYVEGITTLISIVINAFIMYIIICELYRDKRNRENFLIVFTLGAVASGVYGFIQNNGLTFGYGIRYSGTINDPNYSALFYLYGIFSIYCINSIKIQYKMILMAILIIALLRTISLSGIVGGILLTLLLWFIKKPKKGILLAIICVIFFCGFIQANISPDNILYGIHSRLIEVIKNLHLADYDSITSSRYSITNLYLMQFRGQKDLVEVLFGGNNVMLNPFYGSISHNSYIDILFMNGIIGLLFICIYSVIRIIRLIFIFKKTEDETYLGIAFIKIVTLYFAFTISIYSYRYFNMAFWL